MILIYEKNTTFACIYTKSFALFRESFEFIRASFAFIRESFAFIRESYAFVRESFALIREFFFSTKMSPIKALVQETPCYHVHRISCQSPSFVKTSLS